MNRAYSKHARDYASCLPLYVTLSRIPQPLRRMRHTREYQQEEKYPEYSSISIPYIIKAVTLNCYVKNYKILPDYFVILYILLDI